MIVNMGSLFRSEEMSLCQLFLEAEAAYACVSELGELGLVQFRDLNPDVNAFQRKFVTEVRRCEEMERKLRFLEREIKKDEITIPEHDQDPEAPQPKEMIDLEATLEKMETELREVKTNAETLKQNFMELTELRYVLQKTQIFFEEQDGGSQGESMNLSLLPSEITTQGTAQLGFVAGVVLRERLHAFERMLWRVSRGNVFIRQLEIDAPLEDPKTGDSVNKCVFIIFFQGEQLKARVKKICEGFRATLYPCPETAAERKEMATGVSTRIEDLNTVLGQTQDHRHRVLVAAAKNLYLWMMKAKKIKAIYHTLNLFSLDVTNKCLIAECWVPVRDLDGIRDALKVGMEKSGSEVPPVLNKMETKENPPTFNRLNKFTRGFQNLVDAYGVASYQEVNPAPFTCITFPFLFAMMFGDLGHGIIMASFAAWMVLCEKRLQAEKSNNEIWNMFFGGRYIILLMGCFSMYTGLIYNDIFSKAFNIFGTSWSVNYDHHLLHKVKELQLNPGTDYNQIPYPIGVDPVWMVATNKINFLNSYKMKISIIFGVLQMLFGVILSLWNHRFFKKPVDIFCEFIPQILFLILLFGYLVILVFHKWINYAAISDDPAYTPACAPSLLITLINMVLMKGGEDLGENCRTEMYTGQDILQKIFVLVAVLCIPWMLFIKPFILKSQHANQTAISAAQSREEILSAEEGESEPVEKFEFGEVFVHQSIHTIEYCLGSVSHTASYLRLWALSLAHAQLSEVLWGMVMRIGLAGHSFYDVPILFFIFLAWAVLTVGVLVLMEGLSAFLHTLRLHWVEFQSKFYGGQGYLFTPFSFKNLLQDVGRDD